MSWVRLAAIFICLCNCIAADVIPKNNPVYKYSSLSGHSIGLVPFGALTPPKGPRRGPGWAIHVMMGDNKIGKIENSYLCTLFDIQCCQSVIRKLVYGCMCRLDSSVNYIIQSILATSLR